MRRGCTPGSGGANGPGIIAADAAEKKTWTSDEIGKMTVAKLKEALTTLGLDTSGLKAALKDRLTDAMGL